LNFLRRKAERGEKSRRHDHPRGAPVQVGASREKSVRPEFALFVFFGAKNPAPSTRRLGPPATKTRQANLPGFDFQG